MTLYEQFVTLVGVLLIVLSIYLHLLNNYVENTCCN